MAINVNTLNPASIKAKNVATEDYVDNEIAAIPTPDVSGDIASNNDAFAQSLGFEDYEDLASSNVNDKITTINGGKITSGMLEVDVTLAEAIMSKDITYTGVITGGTTAGGGLIKSYDGSMVIDLVQGSIFIS